MSILTKITGLRFIIVSQSSHLAQPSSILYLQYSSIQKMKLSTMSCTEVSCFSSSFSLSLLCLFFPLLFHISCVVNNSRFCLLFYHDHSFSVLHEEVLLFVHVLLEISYQYDQEEIAYPQNVLTISGPPDKHSFLSASD